ncbi:unnamed protein product, partial [Leptidea sinapis]
MMDNGVITNHYDGVYGDGYMEQEEEWEREGLLDPAWEKQQKKNIFDCIKFINIKFHKHLTQAKLALEIGMLMMYLHNRYYNIKTTVIGSKFEYLILNLTSFYHSIIHSFIYSYYIHTKVLLKHALQFAVYLILRLYHFQD